MAEEQLDGGITNAGRVVRDGPHVLRPSGPNTNAVHQLLKAVRSRGFDGAPEPIGVEADGRERLTFIDGEVPLVPYPAWSQSDSALTSIVELLRSFHLASQQFDPTGLTWDRTLADPAGGAVVCHNDVELSNVVFRNGLAVGLLDFEFAAPGRPVYDLAQLARLCVPIEHEFDQKRMGWIPADRPARLRLVADAYGLDGNGRSELLAAMADAMDRVEQAAKANFGRNQPQAAEIAARTGGMEKYDRRRQWWRQHQRRFTAALQ